jgi:hypothetical protein
VVEKTTLITAFSPAANSIAVPAVLVYGRISMVVLACDEFT